MRTRVGQSVNILKMEFYKVESHGKSNLKLEMNLKIRCAAEKVYKSFLYNVLTDENKKPHLMELLTIEEFIIPDSVFQWICCGIKYKAGEIALLLEGKKKMDNFVKNFIDICEKKQLEYLSYQGLESVLQENALNSSVPYKSYVFKLLSDNFYSDPSYVYYPVQNVKNRYKTVDIYIDEVICGEAYLANYGFLKSFIDAVDMLGISYTFKPCENQKHDSIYNWLKRNIYKGTIMPGSRLGWMNGPDNARWPSTNLIDYKETFNLLMWKK